MRRSAHWFKRRAADWPGDARVVAAPSDSHEHGLSVSRDLLSGPGAPTAILTVGDHLAFGALTAIAKLSLSMPSDVSFVTIGNRDSFTPKIAGVRMPYRELGARAVRHLGELIAGTASGPPPLVPTEFRGGGTLGPPAPA